MCLNLLDCQYPGQSCCHTKQEVGTRGLLHEHTEHRTAGSEVSHSFGQGKHTYSKTWPVIHSAFVSRYRSGIRGHMKAVVMDLLRQYLRVEVQFQHGKISTIRLQILRYLKKDKWNIFSVTTWWQCNVLVHSGLLILARERMEKDLY